MKKELFGCEQLFFKLRIFLLQIYGIVHILQLTAGGQVGRHAPLQLPGIGPGLQNPITGSPPSSSSGGLEQSGGRRLPSNVSQYKPGPPTHSAQNSISPYAPIGKEQPQIFAASSSKVQFLGSGVPHSVQLAGIKSNPAIFVSILARYSAVPSP